MECILKGKQSELKTNGTFKKEKNQYYIYVELQETAIRENNYDIIYAYDENDKKVTLVNCYLVGCNHVTENEIVVFKYKINYVVTGWVKDINNESITELHLYFYELDKVFIKDLIKERLTNNGFNIVANRIILNLYENENIKIQVYKLPGISTNRNESIVSTPAKIVISFKNQMIKYEEIFEYVRKIENIFGFIAGNKLNLISIDIFDNEIRNIRYRYLKEKEECKDIESNLTDLHSIKIIKQLIKKYFEDEYINVCIDNYYEYIYNDLASVLKFTSSISLIELLAKQEKYLKKIKAFNRVENKNNSKNDKTIKKIKEKITENEIKLIDEIYKKNGISLRYILRYFFEKIFSCENNEKTIQFIEDIIKTRNYYTHGGKKNKKLNEEEIYYTSELFESVIFLLIINVISPTSFEKRWSIIEMHKYRIINVLKIFNVNVVEK